MYRPGVVDACQSVFFAVNDFGVHLPSQSDLSVLSNFRTSIVYPLSTRFENVSINLIFFLRDFLFEKNSSFLLAIFTRIDKVTASVVIPVLEHRKYCRFHFISFDGFTTNIFHNKYTHTIFFYISCGSKNSWPVHNEHNVLLRWGATYVLTSKKHLTFHTGYFNGFFQFPIGTISIVDFLLKIKIKFVFVSKVFNI